MNTDTHTHIKKEEKKTTKQNSELQNSRDVSLVIPFESAALWFVHAQGSKKIIGHEKVASH